MSKICLLGSTGSIGASTLDVVAQHPEFFEVIALSAHHSVEKLIEQCCRFKPQYVVIGTKELASHLKSKIDCKTQVLIGEEGLKIITQLPEVDKVVAGISGSAGLLPILWAVQAAKQIVIANKEPLVMAGEMLIALADQTGATFLPADSEHNALFQCMPTDYRIGVRPEGVKKLILTASGGPFLNTPAESFLTITPEMACRHPKWQMGKKISVDSATLMNKGMEVIEASRLFGFGADEIEVVIHPQSIVHSMVEYVDGSILAQMGPTDMKVPLAHTLAWPNRIASGVKPLSFYDLGHLSFMAPDYDKFKSLGLAYAALKHGQAAPIVLNASNEVAVSAFLQQKIRFTAIPTIVETVLDKLSDLPNRSLEEILRADTLAREQAMDLI